jgi:hypothetical protein
MLITCNRLVWTTTTTTTRVCRVDVAAVAYNIIMRHRVRVVMRAMRHRVRVVMRAMRHRVRVDRKERVDRKAITNTSTNTNTNTSTNPSTSTKSSSSTKTSTSIQTTMRTRRMGQELMMMSSSGVWMPTLLIVGAAALSLA